MSAREVARLQAVAPGITKNCLEKARIEGFAAVPFTAEQCFELAPARRWRGLWRDDFEGSRFCPEPVDECDYKTSGDIIWLSSSERLKAARALPQRGEGGLFEVEFVGRLTAQRGYYGHFGMSDYEIVVDRLISIRRLRQQ